MHGAWQRVQSIRRLTIQGLHSLHGSCMVKGLSKDFLESFWNPFRFVSLVHGQDTSWTQSSSYKKGQMALRVLYVAKDSRWSLLKIFFESFVRDLGFLLKNFLYKGWEYVFSSYYFFSHNKALHAQLIVFIPFLFIPPPIVIFYQHCHQCYDHKRGSVFRNCRNSLTSGIIAADYSGCGDADWDWRR